MAHPHRRHRRPAAAVSAMAALAALAGCGGPPQAGQAVATPGASTQMISPAGSSTAAAGSTAATARPSATGSPSAAVSVVSLAGRIRPAVTYRGVATAYEAADGGGACLFGPSSDLMIGAMNQTDYEASKASRACGAYVLVRAANGALSPDVVQPTQVQSAQH